MSYKDELDQEKQNSIDDGVPLQDWIKWEYQVSLAIRKIGFKNGNHVRSTALKFGKFV